MNLYKTDYKVLSIQDEKIKLKLDQRNQKGLPMSPKLISTIPLTVFLYESIFPNNNLGANPFKSFESLKVLNEGFENVLSDPGTERSILNFIRENEAFYILGTLLHDYDFGHHEAYCFKEFEFPVTYKADFLIIGRNSQGYHFIFVEMESPVGRITTDKGEFGDVIRKGLPKHRIGKCGLNQIFQVCV